MGEQIVTCDRIASHRIASHRITSCLSWHWTITTVAAMYHHSCHGIVPSQVVIHSCHGISVRSTIIALMPPLGSSPAILKLFKPHTTTASQRQHRENCGASKFYNLREENIRLCDPPVGGINISLSSEKATRTAGTLFNDGSMMLLWVIN